MVISQPIRVRPEPTHRPAATPQAHEGSHAPRLRVVRAVVPSAPGHTLRPRQELDATCPARNPHAWQVTPGWYSDAREQLRQREERVRIELRLAGLPGASEEAVQQAQRAAARLNDQRATFSRLVEENLAGQRQQSARLATQAGCNERGLHTEPNAVYSLWCCP